MEGGCRSRGPYGLWTGPCRFASPRRHLRGQDPEGRQAIGSPSRAGDQVRAGGQPQNRQGPRPHDPALAAAAGGSGDRIVDSRRFLLTSLAGALAAPLAAEAQQARRMPRIGVLATEFPRPLRESLRELGYVDGRDIVFEVRDTRGRPEQLNDLAAELVR